MPSLNKIFLMGRLTKDPELRYTSKGTAVAELGLAVTRVYSDESSQKREESTYIDVALWARLAEIALQYLRKGSPLFVEGRLQLDTWDDKQTGQKRSRLYVVGQNLQLLGRRDGAEPASPPRPVSTPERPAPTRAGVDPELDVDPF
jgi:single-strand DNA-binding protein